jgi:hypothetical protein
MARRKIPAGGGSGGAVSDRKAQENVQNRAYGQTACELLQTAETD